MPSGAGKYRHKVEIQALDQSSPGYAGEPNEDYTTVDTRRARVRPISAKELQRAGATTAQISHVVELRYYAGLTTKHRIKWGSRCLNIVGERTLPDEIKDETWVDVLEDLGKVLSTGFYEQEGSTDLFLTEDGAGFYELES